MTLKGLSIFFYLHPPSLLTPIFSFQSQTPLKKKKKKSTWHIHYYPLSVLHSLVDLFLSFTVTFLKLCSFRIINHLAQISSGYFRPHLTQPLSSNYNTVLLWNSPLSHLLGPILWLLWLLLYNVYCELSLLQQSSWGYQTPPFLQTRNWQTMAHKENLACCLFL